MKIQVVRDDKAFENVAPAWVQKQEVGLGAQGQIHEYRIRSKTIFLHEE